jgi:hypothetical protein
MASDAVAPAAGSKAATTSSGAAASADGTTTVRPATEQAAHIAGFIAGEGCFTGTRTGSRKRRFAFTVGLGSTDATMCWDLLAFFGVGHVYSYPPRKQGYDGETTYSVGSIVDLVEVIVPFMDEHLPHSCKRTQYLAWRGDLLAYWEATARRPKSCVVPGCTRNRRARGLCRQHFYERYGQ